METVPHQIGTAPGDDPSGRAGLPLVIELRPVPDVFASLELLAGERHVILFESAAPRERLGRYSFLTADPYAFVEIPRVVHGQDPLDLLRRILEQHLAAPVPGLPPFQGGAAGLLAYEAGHAWERFPRAVHDEFRCPDVAVGLYDWVLAWDHAADRAWIICQGFPETEPAWRSNRAAERAAWVTQRLSRDVAPRIPAPYAHAPGTVLLNPQQLAPHWPAPGLSGLLSNFTRDAYLETVARAIKYILAGDIFQVNLSQRLLYPATVSPLELYRRLRACNPAPFAGYFANRDWTLASASPERFVCVHDGEVETRPIKGTRRRKANPEADLFTRDELRESEKDRAENVMIVDLLRNDLSRVCRPGSIRVPQLCAVETYETVQHLVSEVRGTLEPDRGPLDLLAAAFPGGSITGAPKVRAMQLIAELEPTARGAYCGSLFYLGYGGQMDSSILIRTFTVARGWVQCPVGGGIVAQSDPAAEYEETLHKAAGMLRALGPGQ